MNGAVTRGSKYTDEDRRNAAIYYAINGTLSAVNRETGIPMQTLSDWTKAEWWEDAIMQVRSEIEDEFRGRCHQIVQKGAEQIIDRIENGNEVHTKDGLMRIKVSAGELAKTTGIFYDKLRLSLNLPTSITDNSGYKKAMQSLAAEFKRLSEQNRRVVSVQESGESEISTGE